MIKYLLQKMLGGDCFEAENGDIIEVHDGDVVVVIKSAKKGELLLIIKGHSCNIAQGRFIALIEQEILVPK